MCRICKKFTSAFRLRVGPLYRYPNPRYQNKKRPLWVVCYSGSGGGTRTLDTRIMIPLL